MENPTFTIRIPKDLKQALIKAAKADDRSITSYIIHALRTQLYLDRTANQRGK